MYNFHHIRSVRKYLTVNLCKTLACSFILSHLDYANSLLYGLLSADLDKFQRIQNLTAKLVQNRTHFDSVTSCLRQLHWLPVKLRIDFKIVVLVFKCSTGGAPAYLRDPISVRSFRRGLCAANSGILLNVPRNSRSTFLDRSFAVAGPCLWNDLPLCIRSKSLLADFKVSVKTHYFC